MKKQKIQNKTNGQVEFTAVIDGVLTPLVIGPGGHYIVKSIEQTNAIKIYIRKQIIEISEIEVNETVETFTPTIHEKDVKLNELISNIPASINENKNDVEQAIEDNYEDDVEPEHKKEPEVIMKPIPESLTTALGKRTKDVINPKSKQPTIEEIRKEKEKVVADKKNKEKEDKDKKAKERERLKEKVEKLRKQNNK
jgi:hypothetical protein